MNTDADKRTRLIARLLRETATKWGHSRWECLERCPREFALRYVHHIHLDLPLWERAPAMSVGIAVHRGLAAHYEPGLVGLGSNDGTWREVIESGNEPEAIKLEAIRLVTAHVNFWSDDSAWWDKVLGVERQIKGVIEEGADTVKFTGRVDLVGKNRLRSVVVDHKTAGRAGDPEADFAMSNQFLGTLAVWKRTRREPLVIVNQLVKTKEVGLDRFQIELSHRKVSSWKRDMVCLQHDYVKYLSNGYFPRRRVSCVRRYGGHCDYFGLCHMGINARGEYRMPTRVNLTKVLV